MKLIAPIVGLIVVVAIALVVRSESRAQAQFGNATGAGSAAQAQVSPEPTEVSAEGTDDDRMDQDEETHDDQARDEQPQATEAPEGEEDAISAPAGVTVTLDQARTTALAANPGTTVVESELENDDGATVYKIKLSNGTKVKVDAHSGAILASEAAERDDD